MKNTTNIVHTITNIFLSAVEKEVSPTYKQPKVTDS